MPGYTYLDHAATTPMHPESVAAMMPYLSEQFANPSGSHRFAREARKAIDDARELMAEVVGCRPGEVVFTSGGTEADNTAIRGTLARRGGRAVCPAADESRLEVAAVAHHQCAHALRPAELVGRQREEVDVRCDRAQIQPTRRLHRIGVQHRLRSMTTHDPGNPCDVVDGADLVVDRHHADHRDIGALLERAGKCVEIRCPGDRGGHDDAAGAVHALEHRMVLGGRAHGAAPTSRKRAPDGRVVGFGATAREHDLTRPATDDLGHQLAGIVAMAAALHLTDVRRLHELTRLAALRDQLVDRVVAALPGVHETVPRAHKVAGSAHLCIDGIENEALLYLLDESGVCASAASACAAGAMEPSHVLAAMGVTRERAQGAVRLTLGATTTAADVDRGVEVLVQAVHQLRRSAPRQAS